MNTKPPKGYISISNAAQILGISYERVLMLAKLRKLPSVKRPFGTKKRWYVLEKNVLMRKNEQHAEHTERMRKYKAYKWKQMQLGEHDDY